MYNQLFFHYIAWRRFKKCLYTLVLLIIIICVIMTKCFRCVFLYRAKWIIGENGGRGVGEERHPAARPLLMDFILAGVVTIDKSLILFFKFLSDMIIYLLSLALFCLSVPISNLTPIVSDRSFQYAPSQFRKYSVPSVQRGRGVSLLMPHTMIPPPLSPSYNYLSSQIRALRFDPSHFRVS